jgi:hypothetical protein
MSIITPTNNKIIISIYYTLWEIVIGISSFIIFFGLFIKFFFHDLEETLMRGYINNSVSFYKPLINKMDSFNIFRDNINKLVDINKLNKELEARETETQEFNAEYDNMLLKYVGIIILIFLGILFIPVILGFISYEHINWTYILCNFALHIILIIIFEIILLYYIIPINNPINISQVFYQIKL